MRYSMKERDGYTAVTTVKSRMVAYEYGKDGNILTHFEPKLGQPREMWLHKRHGLPVWCETEPHVGEFATPQEAMEAATAIDTGNVPVELVRDEAVDSAKVQIYRIVVKTERHIWDMTEDGACTDILWPDKL